MSQKANVTTVSKAQQGMIEKAKLCRTLMGGTPAMRLAGKTYLPQEPKESDKAYANRVSRTTLYNAFGKSVTALTGKLFSKPISLDDNVPGPIKDLLEDVDGRQGSGQDFNRFLSKIMADAMAVGLTHVLVDMPALPTDDAGNIKTLTVAQAKQNNHRPRWLHYKLEDVVSWRIGDSGKLERLVLKEVLIEPDGQWGEKEVTQYRVLYPGKWEIWRKAEKADDWFIAKQGKTTLDFIPIVTFYAAKQVGPFQIEKPLLDDLAQLNAAHWQSASDQRHILHVARVPMLFGTGWDEDVKEGKDQEVGPNRLILQPTGATLQYVEHTGSAIKSGEDDLKRLEDQMSVAAMEPLVPRTGNQTATAKAIDTAEATSALQDISQGLKDAVEQLLVVTGAWLNMKPGATGEVSVFADFSINTGDPAALTELSKARSLGDISREAYLHELKRRNILDDDYDPEEDKGLIDDEGAEELNNMVKQQKAVMDLAGDEPPEDPEDK